MSTPNPDYTHQGSLQISATLSYESKPVPNARVRISTAGEEGGSVVEELLTDESGQSPVITLPAPPVDYSQEPSQPKPYSEYNLQIEAEGYAPAQINGVQVLPESVALQNVTMLPLEVPGEQEEVTIEQNTLYGDFPPKIPEEEVKPLPPSKGYVVLPNPVIPEFVVVHMGAPSNRSAKNYWIPFRDYIKNVACCEIYDTWPSATIQANVLAILSFTLNRVYTEWYRGKGYNFTITNSTAYDHAFSYGRTFYAKISRIVDEIFTSYITKPNIRQPLFTQYCDGKNSSCPNWMSQWGSKSLGDRGYDSIAILKNYYGQDIYLMQANKVEGVPSSYPGKALQVGSSGSAVRTIQQQLNRIAQNYPAIPKLKVDGIYGQQTRTAVEAFQRIFKLATDGVVGPATWYAISNIFVAVSKLAQ